jgi:hypothetical protein
MHKFDYYAAVSSVTKDKETPSDCFSGVLSLSSYTQCRGSYICDILDVNYS